MAEMKPNFALNLSPDGIVLLHRSPRGAWTEVGGIGLDDTKLGENLSFLRSTAVGLEGKGFGTKLIIPESQILYRIVDAPGPYLDERLTQIRTALEGQTPYDVADLAFDWREINGGVQIAVVAKETLDEAEGFAIDHRFNPLSFVCRYEDENGAWEPFFGCTDYAVSLLGVDADVRDTPAAEISGALAADTGESSAVPKDDVEEVSDDLLLADENDADDDPVDEGDAAAPESSNVSFASRRQTDVVIDGATDDRPLDRISARMVFVEDGAEAAPPEAETAEILDAQGKGARNPARQPVLANALKRGAAASAKISAGAAAAVVAAKSAWENRPKRKSPAEAETSTGAIVAADATAHSEPPPDEPLIQAEPDRIGLDFSEKTSRDRRPILAVAGVFALLLLLAGGYGIYAVFSAVSGGADRDQAALDNASFSGSADRGLNANNRAVPRPVDLDTSATESALARPEPLGLANARPVPRSVYEGSVDPDAGQPDTVTPLTELSTEELADIRAAGLPDPTSEEIAENSEPHTGLAALSPEEITILYEDSGILQGLQPLMPPPANLDRDDIFVAALDADLGLNDAVSLPAIENSRPDLPLGLVVSPLAADVVFDLDENGLVKATKDGALAPSGVHVFSGKPVITPPTKPQREILVPVSVLAEIRPRVRPEDLKTGEDAIFVQGRLTLSQLRAKMPKPRPKSQQSLLATGDGTPTELAILNSVQPSGRPENFDETVKKALVALAAASPANEETPDTTLIIPTRASVAKLATTKNAIDRSQLNLIGVYGTPSQRRALLRLPSGRYVKVEIGDRIDGGRIASISENSLAYLKSGRKRVLKIPN